MRITGLIKDQKARDYLKSAYGVVPVDDVSADSLADRPDGDLKMPIFTDGREYFAGGFKWFYSFAPEADQTEFAAAAERVKSARPNVVFNISLPFDPGTRMINYTLDLHGVKDADKRLDLYEGKTRNLVRKSHKNSFALKIGRPPEDFYELYSASMERLKGKPRGREWFASLERSFGDSVVAISLFDESRSDDRGSFGGGSDFCESSGGKLIGVNYCLASKDYVLLMFNVSDPAYWDRAVNDRLYDELIKWSIGKGVRWLDFGPSVAGDDSHNHFKAGFGAKRCYIFDARFGSVSYRLKAFFATKVRNLKLRLRIHQ
jgi:hypothetical protein